MRKWVPTEIGGTGDLVCPSLLCGGGPHPTILFLSMTKLFSVHDKTFSVHDKIFFSVHDKTLFLLTTKLFLSMTKLFSVHCMQNSFLSLTKLFSVHCKTLFCPWQKAIKLFFCPWQSYFLSTAKTLFCPWQNVFASHNSMTSQRRDWERCSVGGLSGAVFTKEIAS